MKIALPLPKLATVPLRIEQLAARGQTQGASWSLAQITEHLAASIEWQLGRLPTYGMPQRLPPQWMRRIFRNLFLRIGRLPKHVPTFGTILPPPEIDLSIAVDRLKSAIAALPESHGPFPIHPFMGDMSKALWVRFHEVHAAHHLRSIQ